SSRSTVMRTISEPARASAATCAAVEATSAVSVLVIDCTTTGAPSPTVTPPTATATDLRRSCGPDWLILVSLPARTCQSAVIASTRGRLFATSMPEPAISPDGALQYFTVAMQQ